MSAVMSGTGRPRFRFIPPRVLNNRDAALDLAELGFPVFPAQSRLHAHPKCPMPRVRWLADATTDFERIDAAWDADPDAAVGMPVPPGFVVVDADGPEGLQQWRDLWVPHGGLPDLPHILTPSGGAHFPFRVPPGVEHGNAIGSLKSKREGGKIDIRGGGRGYVIAQGSDMGDGEAIYCAVNSDCPFLDAPVIPDWLLALLKGGRHDAQDAAQPALAEQPQTTEGGAAPRQAPRAAPAPSRRDVRDHPRVLAWAREGFEREIEAMRNAPEGNRNNQLNESAFSIGQLIAGGFVDAGVAENALLQAAIDNGYAEEDPSGARKTIRSGLEGGKRSPRAIPEHIQAEIRDDEDAAEYGRRAAAPALARAFDGTIHDPVTGEIIAPHHLGAKKRLNLVFAAEIEPVLDVRDFVQGLLVENTVAVAYGESNVGKSFWAADLALHVALGKEWNGCRVEQGGVLYLAMEGGSGFKNRVHAWQAHHGAAEMPFAAITAPLNLRDAKDVAALIEATLEAAERFGCPVKLIVVDTVSRAMAGGDENSSADMGSFVKSVDAIRDATGAAILLVHHTGKDTSRGARGHSLLRAAVDTEIEITCDETTGFRTANVQKQRDLPKSVAISFRLDVVTLGENRHSEPVTTCIVAPGDRNHLYVNNRGKKLPRLPDDQEALLRTIQAVVIDHGTAGQPMAGMPEVKRATRKALQTKLLEVGWLCPPGAVDESISEVRDEVHGSGTARTHIPKSEHKRLHTKLSSLQNKGKIGFTREHVWLI